MIPTEQAWQRVWSVGGEIFSCTFLRKHDYTDQNGVFRPKGSERKITCRREVSRYTKGVIPPAVRLAEDVRNNVLTVFDIRFFNRRRKELLERGFDKDVAYRTAGQESYRRINMRDVVELSIPALEN